MNGAMNEWMMSIDQGMYQTFHKLRKLKYSLHMNAKIETIKEKEGITAINDIQ